MVLHRQVAGYFLGQPEEGHAACVEACLQGEYKFTGTYIHRALAGVDTAVLDLRARRAGVPVCALFGGRAGPIPAYGSSMRRDLNAEQMAGLLVDLQQRDGYGAFKIKIGGRLGRGEDAWPGRTEAVVAGVRAAVAPGTKLIADANGSYGALGAIRVAKEVLEPAGIAMLEEPCPYWDIEGTRSVAEALEMPVSGGEQDFEWHQWRRIVEGRCVDLVQPDLC